MRTKWMLSLLTGAFVAALLTPTALAQDEKKEEKKEKPSITGTVLHEGKAPKPKEEDPGVDPYCKKVHEKEPILDQTVEVGEKGQMANIFVHVVKGLPDKEWSAPEEPVVLDQKGCRYIPHVFGIMAGQKLEVRNSDRTNHNVHGLPKKNKEFNFGQPKPGMKKLVELAKPETFKIKCDVHAWMSTWCHVMEHPFFATTDEKGKFEITGLPPGEYELEFWHESGTQHTKAVTVKAGETTDIGEFKFEIEKKRRPRRGR